MAMAKSPPPVDEAQGAIMSRKALMNLTLKDIANGTGISYERIRRFWNKPPIQWEWRDLIKICAFLGLKAKLVVEDLR